MRARLYSQAEDPHRRLAGRPLRSAGAPDSAAPEGHILSPRRVPAQLLTPRALSTPRTQGATSATTPNRLAPRQPGRASHRDNLRFQGACLRPATASLRSSSLRDGCSCTSGLRDAAGLATPSFRVWYPCSAACSFPALRDGPSRTPSATDPLAPLPRPRDEPGNRLRGRLPSLLAAHGTARGANGASDPGRGRILEPLAVCSGSSPRTPLFHLASHH